MIEAITGKDYDVYMDIKGRDKVSSLVGKIRQKLESNPITQPIV